MAASSTSSSFPLFMLLISSLLLLGSFVSASEKQYAASAPVNKGLSSAFYESSCPDLESIVRKQLKKIFKKDIGQAAGLLRLHFHDCFVQGCDASVLLDGSASGPSEQDAPPNLTLRAKAFEIIEDLRELIHKECGRIVSCADIVALAARDSVVLVYATIKSRSLAIAASTLDSLLNLMADGILCFTHLAMKNRNIYKRPIGNLRMQTVGIIIFAIVMATLGFQVFLRAAEELIKGEPSEKLSKSKLIWICTIMISAIVVKLALWIYCKSLKNDIGRVHAKDHFFDVVNNVVGLAAALLADEFLWWIDPAGAIILALYTIINWSQTVFENAVSLVGQSAPPEVLQKLTYLVMRHPKVKRIDTVRAYTFGVLYFVEVDIELPEELPLKEAHTIGESLQEKLEKLPEVERAFVHLDYECDHKPEHSVPSRLPNNQT